MRKCVGGKAALRAVCQNPGRPCAGPPAQGASGRASIAPFRTFATPPLSPAQARPLLADQPWVTAYRETALYSSPGGSAVLGLVARGTSYRLDPSIPPQRDRLWAWSPYTQGYGWLPAPAVGPGRAPTDAEL